MQAYLQQFTKTIGFPAEATEFFCNLYAKIEADPKAMQTLARLQKRIEIGRVLEGLYRWVQDLTPGLEELAATFGVHRYSMDMLLLLTCTPPMHEKYRFLNYSDEFFYDNATDFTCKLQECWQVHKVWGTFVLTWFFRFFEMHTIKLGRFQYERKVFGHPNYTFGEHTVKNGSFVFNIHIPSSGPMTEEARLDSYKQIYQFVKTPTMPVVPITCTSWLLYPGLREICDPKSNMIGFLNDFDIIAQSTPSADNPFPDAWRVFGMDYTGDPGVLPRDTSLQRRFADHLAAGGVIGGGTGIILFDGEKIINKRR